MKKKWTDLSYLQKEIKKDSNLVQNLKSEKESTLDLNLHQEENRNLKIM